MAAAVASLPEYQAGQHRYVRVMASGEVWVAPRKVPPPAEAVTWRIYDLAGRQLAELTTPEGFALHDVGEDWVLGEWRDSLDVEYVRLYRLAKSGRTPALPRLAEAVAAWQGPPPSFQRIVAQEEAPDARAALMGAAISQEIFYSKNGHYTQSFDSLSSANPRFQIPEAVALHALWVEERGWMFLASDTIARATCSIAYGFVRLMGAPAGTIECWRTEPEPAPSAGR